MKALYLLLNVFTISFPLIRSFEPKIKFATQWKYLFPSIFITALFFITWDVFFTSAGVWGFNAMYLVGLYILGLPLEEWLFFITVPFASVFIYECVLYFIPGVPNHPAFRWLTIGLALILLTTAILSSGQAYTFWNFLFASAFLVSTGITPPRWLGHFWLAYGFHLIPFLLVNGILTGSFLEEPIVWYNNDQTLGFRIFTIPIEDTIYSLLLFLMTTTFYEKFRSLKILGKNASNEPD